jgi:hypothetical protein
MAHLAALHTARYVVVGSTDWHVARLHPANEQSTPAHFSTAARDDATGASSQQRQHDPALTVQSWSLVQLGLGSRSLGAIAGGLAICSLAPQAAASINTTVVVPTRTRDFLCSVTFSNAAMPMPAHGVVRGP